MKSPCCDAARLRKHSSAEAKEVQIKPSPVQGPLAPKPSCPPRQAVRSLFPNTKTVPGKENSTNKEHELTWEDSFEDSGIFSLHNSQLEDLTREEDGERRRSKTFILGHVSHTEKASPIDTRCLEHRPKLPIQDFQQAVCERLATSYARTKRYDWSVVSEEAERHLLDRVIGGHMGQEFVDVFQSLLYRNMRVILTKILALLGEMDLISCKKVSRTWRQIICEDAAALRRCKKAERELQESTNSLRRSELTRDVAETRVVLSCMQRLASTPKPPSSSTPINSVHRASQASHFKDFLKASSGLKTHESLRSCKHCRSPATHYPEVQRATCTRQSCLFDFCTRCLGSYHGSTACRVVQPRTCALSSGSTPILPGSARSKRNLRRL
ncbi:F-box only protein 5 [Synchiropus splendidus]|uniref:F-box only protein 5 n=1 Tax=Synchiropus splendidus TaxID=270530 RepID=UPI00237DDF59|nr:F-box only protein 5 [Synchiropus splendidus]